MNIREKLEKILKDYRGNASDISDNTTFDQIGFDSLDKVELLMKIEEEYNIVFDEDLRVDTVGQLIAKIESLVNSKK